MSSLKEPSRREFLARASGSILAGTGLFKAPGLSGQPTRFTQEFQEPGGRLFLGKDAGMAEPDEDPEHYFFAGIGSATTDPDGNIYVADGRLTEVRVFSPEGRFLRMVGREGKGPGEYSLPTFIRSDGAGFVYIVDSSQRRILQFDLAGEPVRTVSLPDLHGGQSLGPSPVLDFQVLGDGQLLVHSIPYDEVEDLRIFTVLDMKNGARVLDRFGTLPPYPEDMKAAETFAEEAAAEGVTFQDFYQGLFDVDPSSERIFYLKRFHPRELYGYRIGEDEPLLLGVDQELSGGFTKRQVRNRVVVEGNQRTDNAVCLLGETLYARIAETQEGTAVLKGYSVSDGRIVFRRDLPSDMFRLMHVDDKSNVYLADFENQYLIREPL